MKNSVVRLNKKYSVMEIATSRVVPKVCGSSSNIWTQSTRHNDLVQRKLNFGNNTHTNSQTNFWIFDNNIKLETHANSKVPFPNNKQYKVRNFHEKPSYGYLTSDKSKSTKNSFISATSSRLEFSNMNAETRNIGPSSNKSSGISIINTNESEKNSETEHKAVISRQAYPTISAKFGYSDRIKRGKSVDNRRGRQSRNLERNVNKAEKDCPQESTEPSTLTNQNTNSCKFTSDTSSGDKGVWYATKQVPSYSSKLSVKNRVLGKSAQVTECYLYSSKQGRFNDCKITGLEGEYSKTFVSESKSNASLCIMNSKNSYKINSRRMYNSNVLKTAAKKKSGSNKSKFNENSSDNSSVKAKSRYMQRKNMLQSSKNKNNKTNKQVRVTKNFNQDTSRHATAMSHRKAVSSFYDS